MTIDRVIRRRILLGLLVAASFGLLTAWYREVDNGPLHRAQGSVADAAVPLSAAVQRVSRPFRDLWDWGRGLANARDEAQRLQTINQQQAVELARLQQQLADNDRLPHAARLHQEPALLRAPDGVHAARRRRDRAAGRAGRRARPDRQRQRRAASPRSDAVVAGIDRDRAALVGIVARVNAHSSVVTLITSPDFAIGASVPTRARPTASCGPAATGLARARRRARSATPCRSTTSSRRAAGRTRRSTSSRACRKGLPIGVATQVNDPGDALVKVIQVTPLVDLDAFSHVLVLTARGAARRERPAASPATSSCSASPCRWRCCCSWRSPPTSRSSPARPISC